VRGVSIPPPVTAVGPVKSGLLPVSMRLPRANHCHRACAADWFGTVTVSVRLKVNAALLLMALVPERPLASLLPTCSVPPWITVLPV